jgi:hypothetical protein
MSGIGPCGTPVPMEVCWVRKPSFGSRAAES